MIIKEILSPNNPYLKEIIKTKKSPVRERFFLEGTRFVEELPHDCIVEVYTTDPDLHKPFLHTLPDRIKVYHLSLRAMEKICTAMSGQTIACTVQRSEIPRPEKLILLDGVQDPGNVGTIIRTAYAFGFGVILSHGCANPWSAKTLMATAGAFRACYIEQSEDLLSRILSLKKDGFTVFGTALDKNAVPPEHAVAKGKRAIIIGSEGKGVSPAVLAAADKTVFIPMQNPINSLNAASAASIMIYNLR